MDKQDREWHEDISSKSRSSDLWPKNSKTIHEHQFIVPVEWQYLEDENTSISASVTKLRCSGCSKEVER